MFKQFETRLLILYVSSCTPIFIYVLHYVSIHSNGHGVVAGDYLRAELFKGPVIVILMTLSGCSPIRAVVYLGILVILTMMTDCNHMLHVAKSLALGTQYPHLPVITTDSMKPVAETLLNGAACVAQVSFDFLNKCGIFTTFMTFNDTPALRIVW